MDSFHQLPPPILPDLVSSPASMLSPPPPPPPHNNITSLDQTATAECYPTKQQLYQQQCPMFAELSPQPPPPQYRVVSSAAQPTCQQPQQADIVPSEVVEQFEEIMGNENDKVVLTNSVCLLFRFSIDNARGKEVCQAMSASTEIMSRLYFVLTDELFKNDDLILCYATGNLTNISKYEEGRVALLECNLCPMGPQYVPNISKGVESLICSLNSRDSNVVIFAITAVHNLLLDRRVEVQEAAKAQIKYGLKYIVQLLDNQCLMQNYEFKVIVLDCLQILAYGNRENRLIIKKSGGPSLILKTIRENFDNQPTEELIETASRVLKSLSACPENKIDIISHGGIDILTDCIRRNNQDILKTCLWTLRNLSDVINSHDSAHNDCVNQLVDRLLHLLNEYAEHPFIVTCALGILANLTCNNESVKQYICENDGTRLLLNTISIALREGRNFQQIDKEVLEPAVCALCHLMNQTLNPNLAEGARLTIQRNFDLFRPIADPPLGLVLSDELAKAVDKLVNLTFKNHQ